MLQRRALLLGLILGGSFAWSAAPIAEESWMGVYLLGQKVGYMHFATRPTTHAGKAAFLIESLSVIRANVLGQKLEETVATKQVSDERWAPRQLTFTQKSGGRTSAVVAEFFADRVECKQVTEQRTQSKTVKIPAGINLIADHQALMQKQRFKSGETLTFHEFNPALMTIDKNTLTALGEEELELDGVKQRAQVVQHTASLGGGTISSKMWLGANGDLLKMTSLLNLTFVKEAKDQALQFPAGDKPIDIAFATSIRPMKAIDKPREVRYLKLQVGGASALSGIPQDARIKLTRTGDLGVLEVTATKFDAAKGARLPIKATAHAQWLKDGPYVEATDPGIIRQARSIVGEEKNAYRAAQKIRDWVHKRIEWRADIGVMRSARDILGDPAGVCRDAAVLYTALARAAGLPTRIAAGLTYAPAPEAGFFGHAWAETWVGEWVPFDPTLGEGFVDATHLKLAQGEYTCFFDIVSALGQLKLEVLEAR